MQTIYLLCVCILLSFIGTAFAVKCYECNVWKAGYGNLCDNPRIRDDCTVCMKTQTDVYVGYYKSTPRTSQIVSKICSRSRTVRFSHECHNYVSADGTSQRCYCDTDLCNDATKQTYSLWLPLAASLGVLVSYRLQR